MKNREIDETSHLSERVSGSFLVRVWSEPREVEAGERPLRLFVRNLQTGEEHYLATPDQLVSFLAGDIGSRC